MVEHIGFAPSFDPLQIKSSLVRGFVNSALRFALKQKVPSKAIKEFSNDLGKLEPSAFEKKYGVPAARFKHQLRHRDKVQFIKETRTYLNGIADDLLKAEYYWKVIFSSLRINISKAARRRL